MIRKMKRYWKHHRKQVLKKAGEVVTFICASLCFLCLHGIETGDYGLWITLSLLFFSEVILYGWFIGGWMDDIRDDHRKHRRKRL